MGVTPVNNREREDDEVDQVGLSLLQDEQSGTLDYHHMQHRQTDLSLLQQKKQYELNSLYSKEQVTCMIQYIHGYVCISRVKYLVSTINWWWSNKTIQGNQNALKVIWARFMF